MMIVLLQRRFGEGSLEPSVSTREAEGSAP
jgi:hypothetical protein